MSGNNDGSGSWSSRFMKVASAAAVAGGLYAILSSSTSASSEMEVPFGSARREGKERDDGGSGSRPREGATTESWKKPAIGWVKLNVDGSRDGIKSPSAGCGGVLRDASARWLWGFARKLNPNYAVHQTELEAILTGLEVASEMNVKKLIVESDNDSVVSMVVNGVKSNHPDYHVVERIRTEHRRLDWEVRFVSVSNKANRVADRLANDARKLAYENDVCEKYDDPPANCEQLLWEDEIGCMSS